MRLNLGASESSESVSLSDWLESGVASSSDMLEAEEDSGLWAKLEAPSSEVCGPSSSDMLETEEAPGLGALLFEVPFSVACGAISSDILEAEEDSGLGALLEAPFSVPSSEVAGVDRSRRMSR